MNRIFVLDLIRTIAFMLVILQHVACINAFRYNEITEQWWWFSNFYDSISRICVPLFFVLTGALMLGKQSDYNNLKAFLYKRVIKIVIPLIGWSIIYSLYFVYWNDQSLDVLGLF